MGNKNDEVKFIEKVFSVPAETLEKTVETSEAIAKKITRQQPVKKVEEYWRMLGPGLTTGAADDDCSGIATYSQTGSQYGFNLLWLAAFTFPLMAVVQEMCARIGLVTGQGLAANIRKHFPRWVLYICTILLFAANTFNIGADLGAMAKATQLLIPGAGFASLVVFFTVISLALQVYTTYASYAKYLKWLSFILLAYVLSAALININWSNVLTSAVVPKLDFTKDQIFLICGILGTTISPYLFFWQTSQEVEEQIMEGKTTLKSRQAITTDKEIKIMRADVWTGMFFSNMVMFFIIVTCAATLNAAGLTDIKTAADAAAALKPLAGKFAYLLFAIGIIGVGMLAVPVLAGSASYAISESFNWKTGLYRKLKQAYAFYGVIIVSMALGLLMNFTNMDPIKTLIYSAVGNGLVAPMVLVLIVLMSSSKKIMGERANRSTAKTIGWITVALMTVVGLATIGSLIM